MMEALALPQLLWGLAGLWATALLFLAPLRKREPFWPRTALSVAAGSLCYLAAALLAQRAGILLWTEPLLRYASALLLFRLCSGVPLRAALYFGLWSVMVHDLSIECCGFLYHLLSEVCVLPLLPVLLLWAVSLAAVGLTIARWMPDDGTYHAGPRQLTSAFVLWALFLAIRWLYVAAPPEGPFTPLSHALMLLVRFYCVTILYLQHELFRKSAIRQELDMLNHLWVQQRDQYDLAKENIALINQKCHDLKHQIQAMRVMFSDERREEYFKEMEQSVRIYEVLAKTGNEVLDTVLTEKSLYCEANGIQAHCVADGSLLSFMDPVDLYTIFGNALDNAIESVRDSEDREKRIIDVLVYAEKQMLVIQIINPVSGELRFDREGLPMSTKVNDGYHGFGLKSIRHTVKRYGGFLTVKVENGCFYLQILLPVNRDT
ncbi:ATP-binding protein [Intestinimonas sp.]|uniref:ATP-binding protein n=1 Tax=Intestinimonas sp. TaxID=1965293 RepID=UPI00261E043C|nr:sensor histidine kinase [Intestinimonas sp.]